MTRAMKFEGEPGYDVLVPDNLDPSLEGLSNCCDRPISLKTVFLADQFVAQHEWMHSEPLVYAT